MIVIIIRWLVITAAILLCSVLIPGIRVDSLSTAFISAGALGLINVFIKPALIILTLPLNIITLGFFTFIINAFLLRLVAYFISGFYVGGFFAALGGALVISLVSWLANRFIVGTGNKPRTPGNQDYIDLEQKSSGKWE
jgi:putative membrane protein